MLYSLVEMNRAAMAPVRIAARASRAALSSPLNPFGHTEYGRSLSAMADVFESATRYYGKPEWRIDSVSVNSAPVGVTPTVMPGVRRGATWFISARILRRWPLRAMPTSWARNRAF